MSYPGDDFRLLQRQIGLWGTRTFPHSTDHSKLTHLEKELAELRQRPASGEEMADVLMLLCHLAHSHGVDLQAELERKFAANLTRRWGAPDKDGVVEHVRGDR